MYNLPVRFRERQPREQQDQAAPSPNQNDIRTPRSGQMTLPFRPLHADEHDSTTHFQVPSQEIFTFEMPLRPAQRTPMKEPTTYHPPQLAPATPANTRAIGSDSDNSNVTPISTSTNKASEGYAEHVEHAQPTFTPGELWHLTRAMQRDPDMTAQTPPPTIPKEWQLAALKVVQQYTIAEKIASIERWKEDIGTDIGTAMTEVEIQDVKEKDDFFWEARGKRETELVWQQRTTMGKERWEACKRERTRRLNAEAAKRHLRPHIDFNSTTKKLPSEDPATRRWRMAVAAAAAAAARTDAEDKRRRTWSAAVAVTPSRSLKKKKKKKRKSRISWAGDGGEVRVMLTFDEWIGRMTDETPVSMLPSIR